MVLTCACESVQVETVQIWTVFWRTDVRNVFDVTNRNPPYIKVNENDDDTRVVCQKCPLFRGNNMFRP